MNKFINKILKEATKGDDPFFQPKNIEKRLEKRRREIISKIKSGLQNIEESYKNKDWNSEQEKLFLQIFSKFYFDEKYNKQWDGYLIKDENNKNGCIFDLDVDEFLIPEEDIWRIFIKVFHWDYYEAQSFIKQMFKKYFKFYEFTVV